MIKTFLFRIGNVFSRLYQISKTFQSIKLHLYSGYIYGNRKGVNKFYSIGNETFFSPHVKKISGKRYIVIGHRCKFGKGLWLSAFQSNGESPIIKIDDDCDFGDDLHIAASTNVYIGKNVLGGCHILITDHSHGNVTLEESKTHPKLRPLSSKGGIKIGDNVWIGDRVSILQNVEIGYGCIIGTGSVVTKSIPPYSVVAGIPAKVIKQLS